MILEYLFDGVGVKFVIEMFDLAHVEAAKFGGDVLAFNVQLQTVDVSRDSCLVLETLDVLVAVSVTLFQNLDELFIHTLDNCQHAATNSIESLCRIRSLLHFSPIQFLEIFLRKYDILRLILFHHSLSL